MLWILIILSLAQLVFLFFLGNFVVRMADVVKEIKGLNEETQMMFLQSRGLQDIPETGTYDPRFTSSAE